MTEMVMPNDTNPLSNLMGGRLLHWMDVVAAISAQRHSNSIVVTASVDNVSFARSIQLGNIVTLQAKVTRAFNTSMEVKIDVNAEDIPNQRTIYTHTAYFTFVAVDLSGNKIKVPPIDPETEEEQNLFVSALRRRQLRMILAGRMNPKDADELKAIFEEK